MDLVALDKDGLVIDGLSRYRASRMAPCQTTSIETITPEIAKRYLEHNRCNRKMRPGDVNFYASQMRAGLWKLTHEGIAFDTEGNLADGQHRLLAVVKSGTTQQFNVTRNVLTDGVTVIGRGIQRSISDVLHFSGISADRTLVSVVNRIHCGISCQHLKLDVQTVANLIERHRDAIEFSRPVWGIKRKGYTVAVAAIVSKAWYTADRERLAEFIACFCDSDNDPVGHQTVRALRESLLSQPSGSSVHVAMAAQKTAWALEKFLVGQVVKKVRCATRDPFPLPSY